MKSLTLPIKVLSDGRQFLDDVKRGDKLGEKAASLLISVLVLFAIYGAILGAYQGGLQMLSAAIKLPILYLLTSAICLPALFVFGLVFGSRISIGQYFLLLLSALSTIGLLLIAFVPVTIFFLFTSTDYQFFKLLNVAFFAITALFGVKYFYRNMTAIDGPDDPSAPLRRKILLPWIILFAFVGTQLGWTLRPFFGAPGSRFEVVREVGGNFYLDVAKAMREVFATD